MSWYLKSLFLLCSVIATNDAIAESMSSFGSSDSTRCFEESRFALSTDGISYCDKAINSGDLTRRDLAATFSNRGIIHASLGEYTNALADHNRAIELMPGLAEAYINRGNVYFHTRDFDKALHDYDTAAAIGAQPPHTAHYNKALTLLQLKRKDEAIEALQTALQLSPDSKKIKRQLERLEDS